MTTMVMPTRGRRAAGTHTAPAARSTVRSERVDGARGLATAADLLAATAAQPWTDQPAEVRGRPVRRPTGPAVVSQAAQDLLADAAQGLRRAISADTAADRYATAHLAALRAAAAVLAARAKPVRGRRASAWELLAKVAPEFAEWSAFFAAGSAKRQAAQAGITRLIGDREADDMVRQTAEFLELVRTALG